MIRPLRIRHRRMILLTGVVVALIVVSALLARREIPRVEPRVLDRVESPGAAR